MFMKFYFIVDRSCCPELSSRQAEQMSNVCRCLTMQGSIGEHQGFKMNALLHRKAVQWVQEVTQSIAHFGSKTHYIFVSCFVIVLIILYCTFWSRFVWKNGQIVMFVFVCEEMHILDLSVIIFSWKTCIHICACVYYIANHKMIFHPIVLPYCLAQLCFLKLSLLFSLCYF